MDSGYFYHMGTSYFLLMVFWKSFARIFQTHGSIKLLKEKSLQVWILSDLNALHHILPKALEALKTGWVLPKLILIMWLTKRFDVCVLGSDVCQTRRVVWKVRHVPVLWIPPEGLQEHPEEVLEHTRRRKARPVTFWNKGYLSSFQREQTSVFWRGFSPHPNFPLSPIFAYCKF